MDQFSDILALYEDFRRHPGALSGGNGFFDYMAPSSLHSDITCFAYGIRKTMSCIDIRGNDAVSAVTLTPEDLGRRFYLKLTACLFHWERYTCGIRLLVNGQPAYENPEEFFENVNLGWPTVYICLDSSLLRPGVNTLRLQQTGGDTALLVSVLELVSLPKPLPGQQTGFCSAARVGDTFAVSFHTPSLTPELAEVRDLELLGILTDGEETVISLKARTDTPRLTVRIGDQVTETLLPRIVPAHPDRCLVGTDSDDHRHDDSQETDRILEIFTNTSMGDFWQARPQRHRNYFTLSSPDTWQRRIRRLRAFGSSLSLADNEKVMPWYSRLCGGDFIGMHFHEAYLYFCSALERAPELASKLQLNIPAMRGTESFTQSRELFTAALKRMYGSCQDSPGLTSVGSPSLLTVYEARAGFERVTIEPVSNLALLIGAVRGAQPRQWGAHVPTDWYFGEPNDLVKSRKFLLAMQQLYINGADYIYAENALFKTNAFSREDWEDSFCRQNRAYQREFFHYKQTHPREGTLQRDLGVIYGNNEFFLWHEDDRIAELPENGDWDIKLWGKWEDNRHHRCWRAIDAWLPLAQRQNTRENALNLKLFSGSPYGAVDVVPYGADFTGYRALALLGWNTCEDGFSEKLLAALDRGAHVFVSACHFNRTDRPDEAFCHDRQQLLALLGSALGEPVRAGELCLLSGEVPGAGVFARDGQGNVLVWEKAVGKGKLYFGTFADYTCPQLRMDVMQQVLRRMGDTQAQAVCDNPNISFTLRLTGDGHRVVDALNVCPNGTPEDYTLRFRDGTQFTHRLPPCQIRTHLAPPLGEPSGGAVGDWGKVC